MKNLRNSKRIVSFTLPLSPCLPAGRRWGEGGGEGKISNSFGIGFDGWDLMEFYI